MKLTPFLVIVFICFTVGCRKSEKPDAPATGNYLLTVVEEASILTYNEMEAVSMLRLVLMVQDKHSNPTADEVVEVDFRVELKQDGQTYLLLEETRVSEMGKVEFGYSPQLAEVKPKPTGELSIHYRIKDNKTGTFTKQQVTIFDPYPDKIVIVSGDNQEGMWNVELEKPLVVKVVNKKGEPIKDTPLAWTVKWDVNTHSALSGTQEKTDGDGLAQSNFSLGSQTVKPETIIVQVLDYTGAPIPSLNVTFTYHLRRFNYTLVQLGYPKSESNIDYSDYDTYQTEREWKNGDEITIHNGLVFPFKLKLDGEVVAQPQFFSIKNSTSVDVPFSTEDVRLENISVSFTPLSGTRDSVLVNLTIKNDAYRHVAGKTLTIKAKNEIFDADPTDIYGSDIGDVLKIKLGNNGKAEITRKNFPTLRKTVDWSFDNHRSFVWIKTSESGDWLRKDVIGTFYLRTQEVNTRLYSLAYTLLSDFTIVPTDGYFDQYIYYRNIESITLQ